jgi:hypothetical protein
MKNYLDPKYWSGRVTNIIIGLLGIILILVSIIAGKEKTFSIVLISIGTSMLSSALVSGISSRYLIQQTNMMNMIEYWGIDGIYRTQAEINNEANEILKNAKSLDINAMGLKGYRDSQGELIKKRVMNGMRLRILTIDPNSKFLSVVDATEGVVEGATKSTIESLLQWVSQLKEVQLFNGQVEIKTYDHYPYDFYFCIDGTVFTGPYQAKTSQQTITYKFIAKGVGSEYYKQNFESLWNNHEKI